jgi:hypothetical protein
MGGRGLVLGNRQRGGIEVPYQGAADMGGSRHASHVLQYRMGIARAFGISGSKHCELIS